MVFPVILSCLERLELSHEVTFRLSDSRCLTVDSSLHTRVQITALAYCWWKRSFEVGDWSLGRVWNSLTAFRYEGGFPAGRLFSWRTKRGEINRFLPPFGLISFKSPLPWMSWFPLMQQRRAWMRENAHAVQETQLKKMTEISHNKCQITK